MPIEPRTVAMDGYSLVLDLRHPGDLIRAWRAWEPGVHAFLKGFLKPGMIFVDVGAHHGTYTMLASSLVGSTGQVHAVEPTPSSVNLLRQSLLATGATNVEVHEVAAGATDGWCQLSEVGPHMVESGAGQTPMRRLDSLVVTPALVKVDTDGSEDLVIAGMKAILDEGTAVLIEVSDFDYQPFADSIVRVQEPLANLGYASKLVTHRGDLTSFDPVTFRGREAHLLFTRS